MTQPLRILSGGAAQSLVRGVQAEFEASHDCTIEGTFGAVGAMRDQLLAGAPCDVVILSDALIRELETQGHVLSDSANAVGVVRTGIAVKETSPDPFLGSVGALRSVLEAADAIYFPDPAKATAGIHFMKVLRELGVAQSRADRLRTFPNGATAMAAMAAAPERHPIGCTQVTEILYTRGVRLAGLLPPPYELATTYTAAICTRAENPGAARALVRLLCSPEAQPLRASGGFDEKR